MDDFLTRALAKFVLSFVATFLLVGFGWLFRSRKVQECHPPEEKAEIAEVVAEPERFRWYYVFFILLGALAVVWMLPIIAGLMVAAGVMLGFAQYFRLRRLVDRGLRRRGKRWGGVRSFLVAPGVGISRFIRSARRHRNKPA